MTWWMSGAPRPPARPAAAAFPNRPDDPDAARTAGSTGHRDLLAAASIAARAGGGLIPAIHRAESRTAAPGRTCQRVPARRDPGAAPITGAPAGPLAGTGPPQPAPPGRAGKSLAHRRGACNTHP